MIAAIPGDYSHLPSVVWTIFTIVVVLVALGGGYLLMRAITQSAETKRWIDEDDEPASDIWKDFGPAEQSYEKHPMTEAKPLSVIDWISRQQ